jgi:hypothetical protein
VRWCVLAQSGLSTNSGERSQPGPSSGHAEARRRNVLGANEALLKPNPGAEPNAGTEGARGWEVSEQERQRAIRQLAQHSVVHTLSSSPAVQIHHDPYGDEQFD